MTIQSTINTELADNTNYNQQQITWYIKFQSNLALQCDSKKNKKQKNTHHHKESAERSTTLTAYVMYWTQKVKL